MQRVLVLDKNRQPLMPCHPARARELLREGKAAVFRRFPFTVILKHREGGAVQQTRLKLDPGSKTTGIALVAERARRGPTVIWAANLEHRGHSIRKALEQRRGHRRHRRGNLRYREARFDNRTKPEGWLAPSLQHRVDTTMTWVQRLMRWTPVAGISTMLHRFDTQALQNPEITGAEYQQGTLFGYEVKEYLLEKWGHSCAYCDDEQSPLEVDHIHPRSNGGTDRVSNLTIACHDCNQEKGQQPLDLFLKTGKRRRRRMLSNAKAFAGKDAKKIAQRKAHEETRLQRIQNQAKAPLKDAAAVNSTRWALYEALQQTGLPVETGSGGRTKWNRSQQQYPKAHWVDAACVGESGACVRIRPEHRPLTIQAKGHGERQRARLNKHGFAVSHKKVKKFSWGMQSGDMVRAVVPKGKYKGSHTSCVSVRFRPSFALHTSAYENDFDVHPKYMTILHRSDGYAYQ
ncbi:HNH endonuclease [Acidithiobacillus ferrooxidans]|uniref:RNA-guided endonuclease IscB n=1 Tax=Acidithiobacillus ferrooxidans TaxID=920 RepID=UPI001C074079|nr:RNA-guided endonuclease IscB [Acidithiobacillus ferrooxidans]MBU2774280.1 HNH endonuclease [Acidithiobacillus ferrooxidans]